MELASSPVIKIGGNINTDYWGINKISNFFAELATYENTTLQVDFYGLNWMDANLFAFFNAAIHRLIQERNIKLTTDFDFLAQRFNVFFRSGAIGSPQYIYADTQGTTVPYKSFSLDQVDPFVEYIAYQLIGHSGFPTLNPVLMTRIQDNLVEIFQNVRHAQTSEPIFACGQYYPTKEQLKLTLVDLGCGFLEPIKQCTGGQIVSDLQAIEWAVQGNSSDSKDRITGGYALANIKNYCSTGKARMQIYSGQGFWDSAWAGQRWRNQGVTESHFRGSLINLVFNH